MHAHTPARNDRRAAAGWLAALALGAMLILADSTEGGSRAAAAAPSGGIPNPADDRVRMLAELERLNATVASIQSMLERGAAKVEVARMPAQTAR